MTKFFLPCLFSSSLALYIYDFLPQFSNPSISLCLNDPSAYCLLFAIVSLPACVFLFLLLSFYPAFILSMRFHLLFTSWWCCFSFLESFLPSSASLTWVVPAQHSQLKLASSVRHGFKRDCSMPVQRFTQEVQERQHVRLMPGCAISGGKSSTALYFSIH